MFSNVCFGGLAREKNTIEFISIVHVRDVEKRCSLVGPLLMELPQCCSMLVLVVTTDG